MKSGDVIKEIQNAVLEVKDKGQEFLSVKALLTYLDALKNDCDETEIVGQKKFESDLAVFRAEHERNLAHYEAQQQHSLEMFRSIMPFAHSALKSAILINGGAAVALLAFIGKIWGTTGAIHIANSITLSIAFFSFGVLASALASGTSYLTQYGYAVGWGKVKLLHGATVIIIVATYVLFGLGAYEAYSAFSEKLIS